MEWRVSREFSPLASSPSSPSSLSPSSSSPPFSSFRGNGLNGGYKENSFNLPEGHHHPMRKKLCLCISHPIFQKCEESVCVCLYNYCWKLALIKVINGQNFKTILKCKCANFVLRISCVFDDVMVIRGRPYIT